MEDELDAQCLMSHFWGARNGMIGLQSRAADDLMCCLPVTTSGVVSLRSCSRPFGEVRCAVGEEVPPGVGGGMVPSGWLWIVGGGSDFGVPDA